MNESSSRDGWIYGYQSTVRMRGLVSTPPHQSWKYKNGVFVLKPVSEDPFYVFFLPVCTVMYTSCSCSSITAVNELSGQFSIFSFESCQIQRKADYCITSGREPWKRVLPGTDTSGTVSCMGLFEVFAQPSSIESPGEWKDSLKDTLALEKELQAVDFAALKSFNMPLLGQIEREGQIPQTQELWYSQILSACTRFII